MTVPSCREQPVPVRKLNVVHICDHLGWDGSRMHGVKRLFAWMIPRFDRSRFNVSLISLRQAGSLRRHARAVRHRRHLPGTRTSSIPRRCRRCSRCCDAKRADVVHMHGYGATTFGRLCAWRDGHSGDPSRARQPRRHAVVPEDRRPAARAAHRHRDRRVASRPRSSRFARRLMPAERTKVVYLGAPLDEFARPRSSDEVAAARAALGIAPGTHRDRHHHAPDAVEGQRVS